MYGIIPDDFKLQYCMSFFELGKVKIDKLIEYKNIGEQTIQSLKRHRIMTILDLLFYYPNSCNQIPLSTLQNAQNEQIIAVYGEIVKVSRSSNAKIKYIVEFKDTNNAIAKLLFTNNMPLSFKPGQKMIIMGKHSYKTFVHPKIFYITKESNEANWQSDQFQYNVKLPLSDYRMQQCIKAAFQYISTHISATHISKTFAADLSVHNDTVKQLSTEQNAQDAASHTYNDESEFALNKCMELYHAAKASEKSVAEASDMSVTSVAIPEIEIDLSATSSLMTWKMFFESLHGIHGSEKYTDAIKLIPYLEAVAWHLSAQNTQSHTPRHYIYTSIAAKYQDLYDTLIATLTTCQANTFDDIQNDLKTGDSRHRMIFGDVCTGKTRISILASIYAISHDKQVLFLAPTTMLARQHYETFTQTFGTMARIMFHSKNADTSQADIIIGTHSLLYMSDMSNVGLIIIDEQHKFGVLQRHNLISKDANNQSYILSLSATPIPRSLSLIMQKYINVSILRTRTRPVSLKTVCIDSRKTEDIIARLKDKTGMIYWVCPAIEENETGLTSVERRYESLLQLYGDQVKFLHGSMNSDEQAVIYKQALAGQIKILVSTTVIEVGIDIPHADIIIIEHAERFGLAQLHQLRGRVGRHGNDGTCVLLHGKSLSEKSRNRLRAMETITNGFELAEVDMQIRGHGMLLGTQQSGFNEFHYLDPVTDCQILLSANHIAQQMHYENNIDFINHFFSPDSVMS